MKLKRENRVPQELLVSFTKCDFDDLVDSILGKTHSVASDQNQNNAHFSGEIHCAWHLVILRRKVFKIKGL